VHYKEELMKFQSTPGRIVNKRIKRQGRYRVVGWFKFDEKGFATVDETKITATDLNKLKKLFKVVAPKVEEKASNKPMKRSYKELQALYTEKTGKTAVGVSKANILKELEVI
jgi:hypothetical protein